jgi:hypothetical protein
VKPLSVRIVVLLLGVTLEVSAASGYRILSACDDSAEVRANVSKDAEVKINFSITGSSACYSVTATVDGKQIRGYVLDGVLDAVLTFEKARIKASRDTLNAPPVPPAPSEAVPPAQIAAPSVKSTDDANAAKEAPKVKKAVEPLPI